MRLSVSAAALLGLLAACAAPKPASAPSGDAARADERFKNAIYYKPREAGLRGIEETFLPLIVEEAAARESANSQAAPKTVYFGTATTHIGDEQLDQVSYLWTYGDATAEPSGKCGSIRGVRLTVDHDGYPIVWEALSNRAEPKRLFLAASIAERTAVAENPGGVGQGPHSSAADRTVIAGTVEQGPVPMGPYVYLSAPPERVVTTILCRCSPSQVGEFIAEREYDLQPVEALELRCPEQIEGLLKDHPETTLTLPDRRP